MALLQGWPFVRDISGTIIPRLFSEIVAIDVMNKIKLKYDKKSFEHKKWDYRVW